MDYLKFIVVAIALMFLVDHFLWNGERPYMTKIKEDYFKQQNDQQQAQSRPPPTLVLPEDGSEYFEAPPMLGDESLMREKKLKIPKLSSAKKHTGEKAKIAIVIDDIGMNIKHSNIAIDLPPEVSLAILPYAETASEMAERAREKGHQILIHTPMEALDSNVDLGPMALRNNMDFAAFDQEFEKMAQAFDGYIGVNNHMGSSLTQNPEAMGYLMDQLKKRNLFFLDSVTINTTVAAGMAQTYDIPYAKRDVFIDHEETPLFVYKALNKIEKTAKRKGYAVAIGHPKEVTMTALKKWIPTLEKKGFKLVPISEVITWPENRLVEKQQSVNPAAGQ